MQERVSAIDGSKQRGRTSSGERPGSARVAVVVALPAEAGPLRRRLRDRRPAELGGLRCEEGRLGGHEVVLAVTGDGAGAARRGLVRLLDAARPGEIEALVVVGVAGGLSDGLPVGSLVAAAEVRNGSGVVPVPDVAWLKRALGQPGVASGTVVSAAEIALDPIAKRRLGAVLPAGGPAVVDLESATFARLAAGRGVPYLVVRAVSDTVDEALPVDFNRFRGEDGGVRQRRVALHALPRPALWRPLRELGRRVELCAERLADVAEGLLS